MVKYLDLRKETIEQKIKQIDETNKTNEPYSSKELSQILKIHEDTSPISNYNFAILLESINIVSENDVIVETDDKISYSDIRTFKNPDSGPIETMYIDKNENILYKLYKQDYKQEEAPILKIALLNFKASELHIGNLSIVQPITFAQAMLAMSSDEYAKSVFTLIQKQPQNFTSEDIVELINIHRTTDINQLELELSNTNGDIVTFNNSVSDCTMQPWPFTQVADERTHIFFGLMNDYTKEQLRFVLKATTFGTTDDEMKVFKIAETDALSRKDYKEVRKATNVANIKTSNKNNIKKPSIRYIKGRLTKLFNSLNEVTRVKTGISNTLYNKVNGASIDLCALIMSRLYLIMTLFTPKETEKTILITELNTFIREMITKNTNTTVPFTFSLSKFIDNMQPSLIYFVLLDTETFKSKYTKYYQLSHKSSNPVKGFFQPVVGFNQMETNILGGAQQGSRRKKTPKSTGQRKTIAGRSRTIYEGPRGGKYFKKGGKYVRISE